jgi:hypothetical protein
MDSRLPQPVTPIAWIETSPDRRRQRRAPQPRAGKEFAARYFSTCPVCPARTVKSMAKLTQFAPRHHTIRTRAPWSSCALIRSSSSLSSARSCSRFATSRPRKWASIFTTGLEITAAPLKQLAEHRLLRRLLLEQALVPDVADVGSCRGALAVAGESGPSVCRYCSRLHYLRVSAGRSRTATLPPSSAGRARTERLEFEHAALVLVDVRLSVLATLADRFDACPDPPSGCALWHLRGGRLRGLPPALPRRASAASSGRRSHRPPRGRLLCRAPTRSAGCAAHQTLTRAATGR